MASSIGVKTNEQLTNDFKLIQNQFSAIIAEFRELQQNVNSRPQLSDLARSETNLKSAIDGNAQIINTLEEKLALVNRPKDTRYYLSQSEVADFRSNFSKLLAMITQFETLYKNLVAYQSNVTST